MRASLLTISSLFTLVALFVLYLSHGGTKALYAEGGSVWMDISSLELQELLAAEMNRQPSGSRLVPATSYVATRSSTAVYARAGDLLIYRLHYGYRSSPVQFSGWLNAGSGTSRESLCDAERMATVPLAEAAAAASLPIWVFAALGICQWSRRRRRSRSNLCPGCGYSLYLLDSDRCPECGVIVKPLAPRAAGDSE